VKGAPLQLIHGLQLVTEAALPLMMGYIIYIHDWPYTHGLFVGFQTAIHFMKLHSYNSTNLLLREDYLNCKLMDKKPVSPYPNNVTLKDFKYFLVAPTLVYWYDYSRTEAIRWKFLAYKLVFTIFGFLTIYLILLEYVYPVVLRGKEMSVLEAVLHLCLPLFLTFHVLFYVTFDCIPNMYAEVTYFGDRDFYGDWWNCINYDQYLRKWNKVVHEFCFRHVYLESMHRFKVTKFKALMLTMIYSALMHELLACVMLKRIGMIYFIGVMSQMPGSVLQDALGGNLSFKMRNILFWVVNTIAQTFVFVQVFRDHFA